MRVDLNSNEAMRLARTLLLSAVLLLLSSEIAFSQDTLRIKNASKKYDLEVRFESRSETKQNQDPNVLKGPARVSLFRKGALTPFQVLNLPKVEVSKRDLTYNPEVDKRPRKLYDDEYGIIFGDFNFDGKEDLAICNGMGGGYGAPSYNVFLYNNARGVLVKSKELSRLAEGVYLGLFFIDHRKRQLIAFSKSGCCYHETEKYRVVNNRPVLVEKIVEDATGDLIVITTRKLVKNKWIKSVKRVRGERQDSADYQTLGTN